MAYLRNPFTPTFGIVPPYLAGRERLLDEMEGAFRDGLGNPNLCSILIGARGTGKTALLSCIGDRAREQGWIVIDTVAQQGMLEDIILHAADAAAHLAEPLPSRRVTGLTFGQIIGVDWEIGDAPSKNWRMRMEGVLDVLSEHDTGLLITVDEVSVEVEELIQLISLYQLFIRDGRRVGLVMAGLPMHATDLAEDKRITFLRRARKHHIGRIGDAEIRRAFIRTFEDAGKKVSDTALDTAVEAVCGYAYMMQLVGYCIWDEAGDGLDVDEESARRGAERARREFAADVLESTYREMSNGDKAFAMAMLPDREGSTLSVVARRMGKGTNYASTYKKRLLKQGLIAEYPGNTFEFDIPMLREYLAEKSIGV